MLRRRLRYMLILFLVFLAVMSIFSLIVYVVAERALYEDADGQMEAARAAIDANTDDAVENFLNGSNIIYTDKGSFVITHKIFLLLRDSSGEILNAEYLTSFDYMLNIGFSPSNDGKFRTENAERNNTTLYYRTLTHGVRTEGGERYYIQMATDSTEVESSLTIIMDVLVRCTMFAMLVVLVIGWYLSKTLVSGVEEAWERQDEFISYASHELRSPLAVIHSSLELLLETPGVKIIERSELIMNSLTETSRLRKMSSNLLEMVQLQASEMTLKPELIDTEKLIVDFIEPFCFQAEIAGKTLNYWLSPALTITADRQLLTELLAILLENALKYTESGDIIRVSTEEEDGRVILRVADTGIGINDESLSNIFKRFYRDKRQQSKADGSGLGLYIASLIAERHGGTIKAEHNRPKGTVLVVSLPVKRKH